MTCAGLNDPAYLNDRLQLILDEVCDCLDNTSLGRPKDCFISHTSPPDDCCNFLAIWIERIEPTYSFPQVSDRVEKCGDVHRMAQVRLKLNRACWPVLKDNAAAPFPSAAEMQAAAEALLIDANVMWCCVEGTFTTGGLGCERWDCLDFKMNDMLFDAPRGGCAGVSLSFLMELNGCCG